MLSSLPSIDQAVSDERDLGIAFRPAISGPEDDLLEEFLSRYGPRLRADERCTLFRCPRLETGYPDAVFVVWDQSAAAQSLGRRSALTKTDLRLLHLLCSGRSYGDAELRELFGSHARTSIARLESSRLVRRCHDAWEFWPSRASFVVREIVAVEAKISSWTSALRQAERNTWFASRSWVLLPTVPSRSSVIADAAHRGVGVLALDAMPSIPRIAARFPLPRSYASWLFNEWVLRALRGESQ
jgi:hypothetical protein